MQARLAVATIVMLALAGCSGADDPKPETPTDPTNPGATPENPETHGTPQVSTTSLTASITGNVTNGTAPLAVTLELAGDGAPANATWTVTDVVGDNRTAIANGSSLPASVDAVLGPGNHTLIFDIHHNDTLLATSSWAVAVAGELAPAVVSHVVKLTGAFAGDPSPLADAPTQTLTFELPFNPAALTLYTTWDDGVLGNDGEIVDLDVFVKDPSGKQVAAAETLDFEYIHLDEGYTAGTWSIDVLGYNVPVDTSFEIDIIAWGVSPNVALFEGSITGGINVSGRTVGDAPVDHLIAIEQAKTVGVRLTWTAPNYGHCASNAQRVNDFDLEGHLGGKQLLSSGNFIACEFGFADADDLSGEWTMRVVPFAAGGSDYRVTVLWA